MRKDHNGLVGYEVFIAYARTRSSDWIFNYGTDRLPSMNLKRNAHSISLIEHRHGVWGAQL